jgi:hypothetical protein
MESMTGKIPEAVLTAKWLMDYPLKDYTIIKSRR